LHGSRYEPSHPALPWHVGKTLDELRSIGPPEKTRSLSWVTSRLTQLPGHRARLQFLDSLQKEVDFDLFGRGFTPIADKWDGLAPYRYSIAIENHSNPLYWTEKLFDCFLSWTLPIYHGCTRIENFFPTESVVQIDPSHPSAIERVKEVIASDLWEQRVDAIGEARNRLLERFQLFPFVSNQIRADCSRRGPGDPREPVHVSNRHTIRDSLVVRAQALRARRDRGE
jgi:hypothetical protein